MASQQTCTLPFGREPPFPTLLCLLMLPWKMYLSTHITATSNNFTDTITRAGAIAAAAAAQSQLITIHHQSD